MPKTIRVDEGATYEYVIHGIITLLFGSVFILIHWILMLLVFVIAIVLISLKAGIEIDVERRQIRKYRNFLGVL